MFSENLNSIEKCLNNHRRGNDSSRITSLIMTHTNSKMSSNSVPFNKFHKFSLFNKIQFLILAKQKNSEKESLLLMTLRK